VEERGFGGWEIGREFVEKGGKRTKEGPPHAPAHDTSHFAIRYAPDDDFYALVGGRGRFVSPVNPFSIPSPLSHIKRARALSLSEPSVLMFLLLVIFAPALLVLLSRRAVSSLVARAAVRHIKLVRKVGRGRCVLSWILPEPL